MRYMDLRKALLARNIGNAYDLSDDAVYRLSYGRPAPIETRQPEPVIKDRYTNRERALVREMRPTDLIAYHAIRDAAEAGDFSPSFRDLEDLLDCGGGGQKIIKILDRLERLGAIQQIAKRPRMAFRLPAAGLQTATTGLRLREHL